MTTFRFLLVQLGDIGDLVLTTPAIAALRAAYPQSHVALLTSAQAAKVLDQTLVDEVITFDKSSFNGTLSLFRPKNLKRILNLRQGRYDSVIFFQHFTLKLGTLKYVLIAKASGARDIVGLDNGNGWFLTHSLPDEGFGAKHQAQYWLDLVALAGANGEARRAQVALDGGVLPIGLAHGKRIIIHAGSGGYSLARRWSPEKFAQVADTLSQEYDAEIVLVGSPADNAAQVTAAMQQPAIDLTGKTSLTQLADVLRSADLYIGADSGVMHLAAAVRTPTIAIFGPSNHEAWGPWSPGGKVVVLRSGVLCSPCSYVGHHVGLREGCEARTCMRLVTPQQVLDVARAMLNDKPLDAFTPPPIIQPPQRDRVSILSLPVDRITYRQWMNQIDRWVQETDGRAHQVCTVNPEFLVMAQRDFNFSTILRRADLCLPDGVGLLWAAKRLEQPLPERVTGSDGTVMIAEEAAKRGWKLFLLGAAPGVADQAAAVMREHLPGIQVVGTYSGSPAQEEEAAIVEMVNASGADILLVAYGAPQQDKWIARNLPRLKVKMAMGVGGSLDFIAGVIPRAPQKMQDYGLEWLYRLYKQPWRIKRMMRLPVFVALFVLRGSR
ncbi:WecB/TagA/CpsF family glycosyltransferase [Phototrophicus methaneseepsis]|uniref:WecB/TagA/CpsF family glycosyltransferase n=1 Tax=Phototrophicus methaneseepsis TaxID=2710758 RepID=A0A7S8ED92_9CHLR|nr:WecB/TagA/CpsF family glycosyltransferase [Phototrophicus methaneseepsis]QPC84835.1 WecB/TagA/CpsF family glycosyltransferase [Phototrophicus methaneseepsis]